jgi:hypothetical protein
MPAHGIAMRSARMHRGIGSQERSPQSIKADRSAGFLSSIALHFENWISPTDRQVASIAYIGMFLARKKRNSTDVYCAGPLRDAFFGSALGFLWHPTSTRKLLMLPRF